MTAQTEAAAAPAARRAKKVKSFNRQCGECGEMFVTPVKDKLFCSEAHKAAFHNRSSKVGRALVPIAMAWREARNAKGNSPEARAKRAAGNRAMNEMVALIDRACSEDREARRMRKLEYVMRRAVFQGFRYEQESVSWQAVQIEKENAEAAAAKATAAAQKGPKS